MHDEVRRLGGNVTHISRMWNYADAVRHPEPARPRHGLKLIPPRSGIVVDPTGRRYGPAPLIPTFDARYALERMCEDDRKYYWMICNWKIAQRELDVSGSQHNPSIRDKQLGGIQTDLESRGLRQDGEPIPHLYAVGEAAGFGGGGMHGKRSLEGTFLGGCVFSARLAAQSITGARASRAEEVTA